MPEREPVVVIGGGLAGSEASWQLARRGVDVELYEMRPVRPTPAHTTAHLAELVCSNSFKADGLDSATGLLKAELKRCGSLLMEIAERTRVPAGGALAVDRERFASEVSRAIEHEPRVRLVREEMTELPQGRAVIVAAGPLMSEALTRSVARFTGKRHLYFYDAISPIVEGEGIDAARSFRASRYGKGGEDYVNCPLDEAGYEAFVDALLEADPYPLHAFEQTMFFEGCLPIEEMARRGRETLRFGPLKPVGLTDPRTGARPHAVLQLRRENDDGTMLNLVGCQTRLRYGDQRRVFGLVPALAGAEFLRYGQVHRNTFLRHPTALDAVGRPREGWPYLFFAGQLTGVEGYVESIMSGLVAGWNAVRLERGEEPGLPPRETMIGSLYHYLRTADPDGFQPMNANFGLLPPPVPRSRDKRERRRAQVGPALAAIEAWAAENDPALAAVR